MKKILAFSLLMLLVFTGIGYAQTTGYIYDFKQELDWRITKHTATAYDGGTADAHGDHDGTGDPYTVFTVSGMVWITQIIGVCNVDLVGAATLDLGTTDDIDLFSSSQFANTSTWDVGELWQGLAVTSIVGGIILNDGVAINNGFILDGGVVGQSVIIETLAAANITAGQVDWYVIWAPFEVGASIVSP